MIIVNQLNVSTKVRKVGNIMKTIATIKVIPFINTIFSSCKNERVTLQYNAKTGNIFCPEINKILDEKFNSFESAVDGIKQLYSNKMWKLKISI